MHDTNLDDNNVLRYMTPLLPPGASRLNEMVGDAYARAAWTYIIEPSDGTLGALLLFHSPMNVLVNLWLLDKDTFAAHYQSTNHIELGLEPLLRAYLRWRPRLNWDGIHAAMDLAHKRDVYFVTENMAEWPDGLQQLTIHAPVGLWMRGRVDTFLRNTHFISIVGARAATAYGEHVAADLTQGLVDHKWVTVSGAAYGIDGVVHRTTLANEAPTVAFLAGGVERPYPQGHAELINRIAERGVVISEVPPGSAPTRHRFLARNRLIAAVSRAVIVVEAGYRSGSLNTAHHAMSIGLPVGAVPGPITSAASAGTHSLIQNGAALVATASDIEMLTGW